MTIDTAGILNNPLSIQKAILTDYEEKLDGEVAVVDANNTFAFLLESFSRIVADSTVAMDSKLADLYPIRASTTKALFNHLSDFDYVGFFSYPASLKLNITFHRDYLVRNAVAVPNTNYQLVIIPADTLFTIGRFKLGIYYPIHIKINSLIDTVSASYDTTEENPLKSLATNSIEVKSNTYEGIDLISIDIDTYQFDKSVYTEIINPSIGFIKKYQFSNRFYAIRIFDISSGSKVELAYTLSDSVYDVNIPTVNIKVYPETNELQIAIPQIYLTKGLLGTKLRVELFTTLGSLDVSLANLQISDITANFALNDSITDLTYTDVLKNIPTIIMQPKTNRITGGSNSYTFKQMKDYTIYHNGASSVPITRMDLERFFSRNGFIYMAKIDNLTDRRYYSYRKTYFGNEELGVIGGGLTVLYDEEVPNAGVLYQNNDTIVILPTVIFKYTQSIGKFEILDNVQTTNLKNATNTQLVNLLNNSNYYCNPHHIVITTLDRYPACELYDLFTTTTDDLTFIEENMYLSAQLSIVSVVVKHIGDGAGGYTVRIGVQRSEDLKTVSTDDFNIQLTAMSKDGYRIGIQGVFVGTYSEIDVFDFTIATNYKIKGTRITTTNFKSYDNKSLEYEIELSGTMHIATFVKKALFPSVAQDNEILLHLTDDDNSWLAVSLQSFKYTLGSNLSDILDSNILTNWTAIQYEKYPVDVPLVYQHDVYETNTDGTIKVLIDDATGDIVTNKIHSMGDQVFYEGVLIYQHKAGDTVVDLNGTPIQKSARIKDFTFDISAFEYSQKRVNDNFFITLSKDLAAYYETIRLMNNEVLENTNIFFKPIVTTNNCKYRINNSTTVESKLELEFEFNCFVTQAVLDTNSMIDTITTKSIAIIKSHLNDTIISLTEIAADIKSNLSSYINSIDVISINGQNDIQTLMNIEVDKSPKLGMTLFIDNDSRLAYKPKVVINYKPLDT